MNEAAVWPGSDWESFSPADAGLSKSALAASTAILTRPGSNANAYLVVRSGKIVWEQYFEGTDVFDRHHLFSVTKSVLSALVGIALQEKFLQSVDQRVVDFFPERPVEKSSPLNLLTLRHLLSMTSGFIWPRIGWGREPMVERMRHSPDWAQFILGVPIRREEIGVFHYTSACSHLLSAILTRTTGQNACDYARERLFAPLGIQNVKPGVDWEEDSTHNSLGGWGLHLTARELARFGWLYTLNGRWQGQQIIPEEWIAESTNRKNGTHTAYGYQWWLKELHGERVFAGLGVGGQFLFCVPGQDLVMVILSRAIRRWPDRWEVLNGLLESIAKNGDSCA